MLFDKVAKIIYGKSAVLSTNNAEETTYQCAKEGSQTSTLHTHTYMHTHTCTRTHTGTYCILDTEPSLGGPPDHQGLDPQRHSLSQVLWSIQVWLLCMMVNPAPEGKEMVTALRSQHLNVDIKEKEGGISLVAQWLRICLPMQGTQV